MDKKEQYINEFMQKFTKKELAEHFYLTLLRVKKLEEQRDAIASDRDKLLRHKF